MFINFTELVRHKLISGGRGGHPQIGSGSIPSSSSLLVYVSLGKLINPELLLMDGLAPSVAASTSLYECVCE